jgi:hypothetical protein
VRSTGSGKISVPIEPWRKKRDLPPTRSAPGRDGVQRYGRAGVGRPNEKKGEQDDKAT